MLLDSPLSPEDRARLPITGGASVAVFLCGLSMSAQMEVLETAEGQETECNIEIFGEEAEPQPWNLRMARFNFTLSIQF